MKSPLSDDSMLVLELSGIEIDYCPFTHGIWLDAGELETLLGNEEEAKKLIGTFKPDTACREKKVRCPICRQKMDKVLVDDKITVDSCRKGHGLWFDEGELMLILELEQSDNGKKVADLLRDMFSHTINNSNNKP